ncbi:MAG: AMP-binding protein [Sulfobacillus sp.]|nr:AMP-binding protein [Sulfobacillus sp.]
MPDVTYPSRFNITEMIFSPWDTDDAPNRPAVLYQNQVWSYRRLIDEIDKAGQAVRAIGVEREHRVLLLAYDTPYFLAVFFGAIRAFLDEYELGQAQPPAFR